MQDREQISIRNLCGIYILYDLNEAVYVGQSKNILRRVLTHMNNEDKIFDSFQFIRYDITTLNAREKYWIKKLEPKYNRMSRNTSNKLANTTISVLLKVPLDIHMKIRALVDEDRLLNKEISIKEKYKELIKTSLNL